MIPLRLRRRRDGSLCVANIHGTVDATTAEFPATHAFSFDWLFANGDVVSLDGDAIRLDLANGRASYRIVNRGPGGVEVELVSSEVFEAPPIDEAKAEQIAAARAATSGDTGVESASTAAAGTAVVRDDEGNEV